MPTSASSSSVRARAPVAAQALVQLEDLADLPLDRVQRVERGHRLLEHHGDVVAAHLAHRILVGGDQVLPVEQHLCRTDDGPTGSSAASGSTAPRPTCPSRTRRRSPASRPWRGRRRRDRRPASRARPGGRRRTGSRRRGGGRGSRYELGSQVSRAVNGQLDKFESTGRPEPSAIAFDARSSIWRRRVTKCVQPK